MKITLLAAFCSEIDLLPVSHVHVTYFRWSLFLSSLQRLHILCLTVFFYLHPFLHISGPFINLKASCNVLIPSPRVCLSSNSLCSPQTSISSSNRHSLEFFHNLPTLPGFYINAASLVPLKIPSVTSFFNFQTVHLLIISTSWLSSPSSRSKHTQIINLDSGIHCSFRITTTSPVSVFTLSDQDVMNHSPANLRLSIHYLLNPNFCRQQSYPMDFLYTSHLNKPVLAHPSCTLTFLSMQSPKDSRSQNVFLDLPPYPQTHHLSPSLTSHSLSQYWDKQCLFAPFSRPIPHCCPAL